MKSYYSILLLLAAATNTFALPQAGGTLDDPSANGPNRTNTGPPAIADGVQNADAAAGKQKCIKFTSDNNNWHFARTGPWGSGTGSFGSLNNNEICVPYTTTTQGGGAIYIGPDANPGPGSTKFECFFPSDGDTAYCDMSLVDGYSLSVTCKYGGITFGGPKDLWKTGKVCNDKSLISEGICKNDHGYDPTQATVDPFFKEGLQNGNHYCIWKNCKIFTAPVGAPMTCHVSGTNKSS